MEIKEILELLPGSWAEYTLEMFEKTVDCVINEDNSNVLAGIENTLQVVSKITGVDISELEQLSMMDINKIGQKLSFMTQPIDTQKKTSINWKPIEKVSYDDYITFMQISEDHLRNLHQFVRVFSTELDEQEILQLPIEDVLSGFFLLMKTVNRSVKHSIRQEKRKLRKAGVTVH
jgi:hypothetical protein